MASQWDDTYDTIGPRLEELRGQAQEAYARGHASRPPKRERPRPPAPAASDREKSIAIAVELRGLIGDAPMAPKDLRNVIREYRELISRAPELLMTAIEEAIKAEFLATNEILQAEVTRKSDELANSVIETRRVILEQLTLAKLTPAPGSRGNYLMFEWADGTEAILPVERGKI